MHIWSLASRLLSIMVIASLLVAPLASPSGAATGASARMATADDVVAMPDGMQCCPDQKPSLPDCRQSCPLAVLCMVFGFPTAPAASVFIPVRLGVIDPKALGHDSWRDLLLDPPPPKPPRA